MKIARGIFASMLFIVLLVLIYYSHISYFKVNVVFYAAIADGIIAAIAAGVILFAVDYFRVLGIFEKLQLIIIWLLMGYSLAISIPTIIDRSLSFYILEKLQQRGGGIRQESFEQVFTQEYMKEYRLIDVRLTEQLESGTIKIVNGCVMLTVKGKKFASVSSYFRKHWLPNERLLMGKYSDDLTDPFRNSIVTPNYTCK